jgi:YggT family protein
VAETFLRNFLLFFLLALWLLVLGRVLMTWVDPAGRTALSAFLTQTTEPIIAPVRRFMPKNGILDLSMLIVLIVLSLLWRALLRS